MDKNHILSSSRANTLLILCISIITLLYTSLVNNGFAKTIYDANPDFFFISISFPLALGLAFLLASTKPKIKTDKKERLINGTSVILEFLLSTLIATMVAGSLRVYLLPKLPFLKQAWFQYLHASEPILYILIIYITGKLLFEWKILKYVRGEMRKKIE